MPNRNEEEADVVEMTAEEQELQKLVGRELRRLREALGLSRMDMAARMGPTYTGEFVAQYEDGSIPMEVGPFFAMLRVLQPDLAELTPKRLMARRLSTEYLHMDGETQELVDHIVEKFMTAQSSAS